LQPAGSSRELCFAFSANSGRPRCDRPADLLPEQQPVVVAKVVHYAALRVMRQAHGRQPSSRSGGNPPRILRQRPALQPVLMTFTHGPNKVRVQQHAPIRESRPSATNGASRNRPLALAYSDLAHIDTDPPPCHVLGWHRQVYDRPSDRCHRISSFPRPTIRAGIGDSASTCALARVPRPLETKVLTSTGQNRRLTVRSPDRRARSMIDGLMQTHRLPAGRLADRFRHKCKSPDSGQRLKCELSTRTRNHFTGSRAKRSQL